MKLSKKNIFLIGLGILLLGAAIYWFFFRTSAKAKRMYPFMSDWSDEKIRFAKDYYVKSYSNALTQDTGWTEGRLHAAMMVAGEQGDVSPDSETVRSMEMGEVRGLADSLVSSESDLSSRTDIIDTYSDQGSFDEYLADIAKENAKWYWNTGESNAQDYLSGQGWNAAWNEFRNRQGLNLQGFPA